MSFLEELNQACRDGRHDIVDSILSNGHIPTDESMTIACERGDQTLVLKLLQYPDLDVQPGFMKAVQNNHFHLLDHLYTRIDVNKPDQYGLTALCIARDVDASQWLLDMGALQTPNNNGNTPLHCACHNGYIEIVKLLLSHMDTHGQAQTPNNDGNTPLHYACHNGHTEIVELLLQHMDIHGQVQTPNIYENIPLHIACYYGFTEVVKLLLQHMDSHGQMQTTDDVGNTALHYACMCGNPKIVKLLLSHMNIHGQVHTPNNDGELPIDIARKKGYISIVVLLKQ